MRINHLLLASLLIGGPSTVALAAAQPTDPSTTATNAPSSAMDTSPPGADAGDFTWSGAYFGVNVGDAFDSRTRFNRTTGFLENNSNALVTGLRPRTHSIKDSGVTAGGQIGLNFQLGAFNDDGLAMVVGVEGDIAYTRLNQTDTLSNTSNFGPLGTPSDTPYTRVNQYHSKLDFLGTARGRVGVASRSVYAYGTAGFAYGRVRRDIVFYGPNASDTPYFQGSNNGTKTGYAYGGGLEFAVPTGSFLSRLSPFHTSAVTLKGEFLRYHIGNDTLVFPGVNGGATIGGYSSRVHTSGNIARGGINYKF